MKSYSLEHEKNLKRKSILSQTWWCDLGYDLLKVIHHVKIMLNCCSLNF